MLSHVRENIESNPDAIKAFAGFFDEFREVRQKLADALIRIEELEKARPVPTKAKRYYSVKDTALELNVSEKSVRRAIERGFLKVSRGLRHIRVPAEELDAYQARTVI
ncbi:MAG: helix-turn-helix domain-containing protein [Chthoniobacteraceae bacterium]